MSVQVEVWGPYAAFNQAAFKVERVSYEVMTPSAARGILESVLAHPGMRWCIDRIQVCNPIRFTNVRRNEVKQVISDRDVWQVMQGKDKPLALYVTSDTVIQRASMILKDVRYVITAHFEMLDRAAPGDNSGKFQDMMRRRLEKGQCYSTPYLGTREFPAYFNPCIEPPPCPDELRGVYKLGWMFYDFDYSDPKDPQPMFFCPTMHDGVIEVPPRDSKEVRR